MNSNDHAQQHAEATRRTATSWHAYTAPNAEAQGRPRATEAAAKSDALRRSATYHRDLPINGGGIP